MSGLARVPGTTAPATLIGSFALDANDTAESGAGDTPYAIEGGTEEVEVK